MAFGCCAGAMEVFKSADKRIDEERLAPVVERLREEGVTDSGIEAVKVCTCLCHVDGSHQVMC